MIGVELQDRLEGLGMPLVSIESEPGFPWFPCFPWAWCFAAGGLAAAAGPSTTAGMNAASSAQSAIRPSLMDIDDLRITAPPFGW